MTFVKVDCLGIKAVRDEMSELNYFSSSVTVPDLCSMFVKRSDKLKSRPDCPYFRPFSCYNVQIISR